LVLRAHLVRRRRPHPYSRYLTRRGSIAGMAVIIRVCICAPINFFPFGSVRYKSDCFLPLASRQIPWLGWGTDDGFFVFSRRHSRFIAPPLHMTGFGPQRPSAILEADHRPISRIDPGSRSSTDHRLPKQVDPGLPLPIIAGFLRLIKARISQPEPHARPERVRGFRVAVGITYPFGWNVPSKSILLSNCVPNGHPGSCPKCLASSCWLDRLDKRGR
jgi:hypothetical protein